MQREAQLCASLVTALLLSLAPDSARAQADSLPAILAARDRAAVQSPDSVTFSVRLQSEVEIDKVVIEKKVI